MNKITAEKLIIAISPLALVCAIFLAMYYLTPATGFIFILVLLLITIGFIIAFL